MIKKESTSMEKLWHQVKFKVQQDIEKYLYKMWIEPIDFICSENNIITLSSPNNTLTNRIKNNYIDIFETEFISLGHNIKIEMETKKIESSYIKYNPIKPIKKTQSEQMFLPGMDIRFNNGRMFKKDYTFENFIVGDNNSYAYKASYDIADKKSYNNILYLFANTGLGKTHLSQAAGYYILKEGLGDSVYYITAEDFTNEMVYSIKNRTVNKFKDKYRTQCDFLILEDIHFLSGKDAIQSELAITLDYLLDNDKKIIFSGYYTPNETPKINANLKSRLNSGIISKINPPDFKTRINIIKNKAKNINLILPNDVIDYFAQELCDDIRQIESGVNNISARSRMLKEEINIELAKDIVKNIAKHKKTITIDFIKEVICKEFSVTEKDLVSPSRKQRIVKPRHIAIFLSHKYTDQPLQKIGQSFNRYHATAIYSINLIEKGLQQKGQLFEQMQYLYEKIEKGNINGA